MAYPRPGPLGPNPLGSQQMSLWPPVGAPAHFSCAVQESGAGVQSRSRPVFKALLPAMGPDPAPGFRAQTQSWAPPPKFPEYGLLEFPAEYLDSMYPSGNGGLVPGSISRVLWVPR